MLVMLKLDWPGQFRRVVRDEDGNEKEVITFTKGEPQELSGEQLEAVRDDIGKALYEVERDDKGKLERFRIKDKQPEPLPKKKPVRQAARPAEPTPPVVAPSKVIYPKVETR